MTDPTSPRGSYHRGTEGTEKKKAIGGAVARIVRSGATVIRPCIRAASAGNALKRCRHRVVRCFTRVVRCVYGASGPPTALVGWPTALVGQATTSVEQPHTTVQGSTTLVEQPSTTVKQRTTTVGGTKTIFSRVIGNVRSSDGASASIRASEERRARCPSHWKNTGGIPAPQAAAHRSRSGLLLHKVPSSSVPH